MDSQIIYRDHDIRSGDHVTFAHDEWSLVGSDIIVLDAEPVPGSTQCLVRAGGETRTVSRAELRPA